MCNESAQPAAADFTPEPPYSVTDLLRGLGSDGCAQYTQFVLVDLDNHRSALEAIGEVFEDVLIIAVHGPNLPGGAPTIPNTPNVQVCSSLTPSKNAADVALGYVAGKLAVYARQDASFVLVSSDKCFQELEQLIRNEGFDVTLHADCTDRDGLRALIRTAGDVADDIADAVSDATHTATVILVVGPGAASWMKLRTLSLSASRYCYGKLAEIMKEGVYAPHAFLRGRLQSGDDISEPDFSWSELLQFTESGMAEVVYVPVRYAEDVPEGLNLPRIHIG